MASYKSQLKRELRKAKKNYYQALRNYEKVSIKDPLWEEVINALNHARINYDTARSRLENLKRGSSIEETTVPKLNN